MTPATLESSVDQLLPVAAGLFDEIGRRTTRDGAICREPFGPGEQIAADLVSNAARDLDFDVAADLAGNLHIKWDALGDDVQTCMTGSHLDSVPRGGNFDGLAGVLAGLIAVAALRQAGLKPCVNLTALALRGEENAWFACNHIGSRIALGLFEPRLLEEAKRYDTGLSLGHYIRDAGFDLQPIRMRARSITPARVRSFLELHIEQGPALVNAGLGVGVVSGIRGTLRHRSCECHGAYGHAGTVPRHLRHDAVAAVADLIVGMDRYWVQSETSGEDLVMTFGQVATNPESHAVTVIPGEVRFSFEARSHSRRTLDQAEKTLQDSAAAIGEKRGVTFLLDPPSRSDPVPMDATLRAELIKTAEDLGVPTIELASGAGHDAADFAEAGIRSGMIFVRNPNGSHNPEEAMSMEDFRTAVLVMASALATEATTAD